MLANNLEGWQGVAIIAIVVGTVVAMIICDAIYTWIYWKNKQKSEICSRKR